ncbi:MAG: MFS transporter [Pseudomonadota bacterium]
MTRQEVRAGLSLASIFALRMLGLFLILPIFAVHAREIPGGDDLKLVGLALGAYGLTQALLQLPFGIASDRWGRKPVIAAGLAVFALGSFFAAWAPNIEMIIVGRALQGAGAVSAAVSALAADLTREQHRTKVMAMIGASIGLMFFVSLVGGPLVYAAVGLQGIFWLTGLLALGGMLVLWRLVPPQPEPRIASQGLEGLAAVLRDPQLLRLDFGILVLHAGQMAMFVVVPQALVAVGGLAAEAHWKVYLPVVLASFLFMAPAIMGAERRGRLKPLFVGAVALLAASQAAYPFAMHSFAGLLSVLLAFFVAFNILEASLPSLISRIAPPAAKGAALGVYNTMQSLGLFLGSAIGGVLAKHYGAEGVFAFVAFLSLAWLMLALTMEPPPLVALKEFFIHAHVDIDTVSRELPKLPGVREARVEPDKRMAYLKVNLERWDEARLRKLLGGEI